MVMVRGWAKGTREGISSLSLLPTLSSSPGPSVTNSLTSLGVGVGAGGKGPEGISRLFFSVGAGVSTGWERSCPSSGTSPSPLGGRGRGSGRGGEGGGEGAGEVEREVAVVRAASIPEGEGNEAAALGDDCTWRVTVGINQKLMCEWRASDEARGPRNLGWKVADWVKGGGGNRIPEGRHHEGSKQYMR